MPPRKMADIDKHRNSEVTPTRDLIEECFWPQVCRQYEDASATEWRGLAMLFLKHVCGWSIDQISVAVSLHKGNVSRQLEAAAELFKQRVGWKPETEVQVRIPLLVLQDVLAGNLPLSALEEAANLDVDSFLRNFHERDRKRT